MTKLITLEQLLKSVDKDDKPVTEYRVSVQKTFDRGVLFIIHPQDVGGDTLDFMVSDNILTDPKGGRLNRLATVPELKKKGEKVIITKGDIGTLKL